MSAVKAEIAETNQRLAALEKQVEAVKADTQAALRAVNVQARYASRVQSVVRATPLDAFTVAINAPIDADRAAIAAKGK